MQAFFAILRPLVSPALLMAALGLGSCLMLGGATRPGYLGDVVLQFVAIPVLVVTLGLWTAYEPGPHRNAVRLALLLCVLVLLLPIVQLVPLPPAIWTRLGGREVITESYALLQQDLPWRPLSVTPHMTWFALLSFVPAVAVFLATLQTGWGGRRILSLLLVLFGAFSVFLGFLQVAQGPSSPLRLFAITNPQEAVGMFANRNHFAALLYSVLVMTLAWSVATTTELAATIRSKGTYPTHLLVPTILGAALLTALFAAQLMARSRAGIGLSVLILLIALAIPPPKGTVGKARALKGYLLGRFAIAGGLLLLLLVGSSSIYRIVERFDADPLKDSRLPFGRNTIEAALAHMPFGSGIGSFTPVYAAFEKVDDARSAFANRAHNDILEAWLETGVLGIAVFALFIVWALARTLTVFRNRHSGGMAGLDAMLAMAAAAIIALLLVHSLVDYPMRTAAISGLFAFACALLLPPPEAVAVREVGAFEPRRGGARPHSTDARPSAGVPADAEVNTVTQQADAGSPAPWQTSASSAWRGPTVEAPLASEPRANRSSETIWPEAWRSSPQPPSAPLQPPPTPDGKIDSQPVPPLVPGAPSKIEWPGGGNA